MHIRNIKIISISIISFLAVYVAVGFLAPHMPLPDSVTTKYDTYGEWYESTDRATTNNVISFIDRTNGYFIIGMCPSCAFSIIHASELAKSVNQSLTNKGS